MILKNSTHWSTRDLKKIATRVVREELPKDRFGNRAKRYTVYVGYNRSANRNTFSSGHAYYHGNDCHVNVPSGEVDPVDFAYVLGHEVGHSKGLRHGHMAPHHGDSTGHRSDYAMAHYAWATEMIIHRQPVKVKKVTADAKLVHAQHMLAFATTKVKRATTILKKWQRKVRYYQKQQEKAACRAGEVELG